MFYDFLKSTRFSWVSLQRWPKRCVRIFRDDGCSGCCQCRHYINSIVVVRQGVTKLHSNCAGRILPVANTWQPSICAKDTSTSHFIPKRRNSGHSFGKTFVIAGARLPSDWPHSPGILAASSVPLLASVPPEHLRVHRGRVVRVRFRHKPARRRPGAFRRNRRRNGDVTLGNRCMQ